VIVIGQTYHKNGGGGFYTTQNMETSHRKGDKFKRGAIIAFNPDFFEPIHGSNQVEYKTGKYALVALLESEKNFEDSVYISKNLPKNLVSNPVDDRLIVLDKNTVVHAVADIGTEVQYDSPLIIFEDTEIPEGLVVKADDDPETLELLNRFNRKIPKAKCHGEVVMVDVIYNCEIKDMSPSLQKVVKSFTRKEKMRATVAKGTASEQKFISPEKMDVEKIGITELPKDSSVALRFFIRHEDVVSGADKLSFCYSLKCTTHSVAQHPMIAIETGQEIDAMFGNNAIYNRVTPSAYSVGLLERYMEEFQNQQVDEYFK